MFYKHGNISKNEKKKATEKSKKDVQKKATVKNNKSTAIND